MILALHADIAAADLSSTANFSIGPQQLSSALFKYSEQSGVQVTSASDLVDGKSSGGALGSLSARRALEQILQGTNLGYDVVNDNTVVIVSQAAAEGKTPVADRSNFLDEITVVARRTRNEATTGTKTNIPILETPQSVSVVTRDLFEARGVTSLNEALRYTAGVASETRGVQTRYDEFHLRGFRPPAYLDGMRLLGGPYSTPQVPPARIERIEVLKGPASVLYGNSTPGGLINMISRLPSAQSFNEASVRVGNFNLREASIDFGDSIGDDYLYRIVGLMHESDGFAPHTKGERRLIQPSFTWRVSDVTEFTLMGFYQHDPRGASFGTVPAVGSVLPNPLGKIPRDFWDGDPNHERFDRTQKSGSYFFTHRFSDGWAFRQNLRYLEADVEYRSLYGIGLAADFRTMHRGGAASTERFNALTLDNQLSMSAGTGPLTHNALIGVDYQRSRGGYQQYFMNTVGVMPGIDLFAPVYGVSVPHVPYNISTYVDRQQLGAYAQDQIKLGALSLIASGRYDWYDADTVNRFTDVVTPHKQEAFTGRLGLLYLFDSGIAPYVSYSESFEPQIGADFAGTPFEPTTGSQVEVGVKYEPPGTDSLLTLSAYQLKRQKVPTPDPDHPPFEQQTGEVTMRGIELEARMTVGSVFDLTSAYTYLDAVNTQSTLIVDGIPIRGLRPQQLPEHAASLWGLYRFRAGALAGLDVGGGVRYVAESFGDTAATFTTPSYTLADFIVRYEPGPQWPGLQGIVLSLQVSNVFDRTYIASCMRLRTCYVGPPRTTEFGIKYTW